MKSICIFLMLIIISCSSLNTIKKGKSNGLTKKYNISYEQAWEASKSILRKYSTDQHGRISIQYDLENNYMATPVNNGFIGIWIDKIDEETVLVTAYSKKTLATYIYMSLTQDEFHEMLNKEISNKSK